MQEYELALSLCLELAPGIVVCICYSCIYIKVTLISGENQVFLKEYMNIQDIKWNLDNIIIAISMESSIVLSYY